MRFSMAANRFRKPYKNVSRGYGNPLQDASHFYKRFAALFRVFVGMDRRAFVGFCRKMSKST